MLKTVEIAGGGLAGLSLGVALRKRGVPVVVREAGTYPRHRVCGEFLNGVTERTLQVLGVEHLFTDALKHERTGWWIEGRPVLETRLEKPALGLSRWEMDQRLAGELLKQGGTLQVKTRVPRLDREGLVWTAGRILEKQSRWIGLKAHFTGVEVEGLEMHLGRGGYVGLTPVHEGVNVAGLFTEPLSQTGQRRDQRRGAGTLISYLSSIGLEQLADRLRAGAMIKKSLTGVSHFALGGQRGEEGLMVLGDAERMIPPFTGNGMSMAFESAECALRPVHAWAEGALSWEEARSEVRLALDQRFQERVRLALLLHRFLVTGVGRASLGAAARSHLLPFHWLHRRLS